MESEKSLFDDDDIVYDPIEWELELINGSDERRDSGSDQGTNYTPPEFTGDANIVQEDGTIERT